MLAVPHPELMGWPGHTRRPVPVPPRAEMIRRIKPFNPDS